MAQINKKNLRLLFLCLLPFLALIPPVIEKVRGLHSPQITIWAAVVTFIVCAMLALALVFLGRNNWKHKRFATFFQIALLATIVFLYIDIGFSGVAIIGKVFPFEGQFGKWQTLFLHALFFCVTTALIGLAIWKLKEDAINILTLLFGVVALSSLFISGQRPLDNWERAESPAVHKRGNSAPSLVIVLDAMVGAEGIDRSIPGGEKLYWLVRDFHERYGFKLFGRSFSRYRSTSFSIPNTLNNRYSLDGNGDDLLADDEASQSKILLSSAFFDQSEKSKRDIIVYQTQYVNYCQHPLVSTCKTLSIFDPLNGYVSTELQLSGLALFYKQFRDIMLKNSIALKYIFSFSTVVISSFSSASTNEFLTYPHLKKYINLSFSKWWDAFQSKVLMSSSGELIFAHIYTPHTPEHLDPQCKPLNDLWKQKGTVGLELTETEGLIGQAFEMSRARHMTNYFNQVECVYKKLDGLLDQIDKDDLLREMTIILMGDHGSRHSAGKSYEYLEKQDYIDNYSTLFSIKSTNQEPGYDERMISVQQLFGAAQFDDMDTGLTEIVNTVVVSSIEMDEPVVVRMPDF